MRTQTTYILVFQKKSHNNSFEKFSTSHDHSGNLCVNIHKNKKWKAIVFANGPRDLGSITGRVIPKTLKMVLDTSLLNRYVSRVKWSNPGKGLAPFPTLRCCSYWKGSLLVALDNGRQFYIYIYRGTVFLNIVTGVLQGDTLASYMYLISSRLRTTNINRSNSRKWFHIKKDKRRYQTENYRLRKCSSASHE